MTAKTLGAYIPQLKDCPFCGYAAMMHDDLIDVPDSNLWYAKIDCRGCNIEMEGESVPGINWRLEGKAREIAWGTFETQLKHGLATRWNTRAE